MSSEQTSPTEAEWKLLSALVAGNLSESQFLRHLYGSSEAAKSRGLSLLRQGAERQDSASVEMGIVIGHRFGFTDEWIDILCQLLPHPWHHSHEDIVDALGDLRAEAAVDVIADAVSLSRQWGRVSDDTARKAMWVLGGLATERAIARLRALAVSGELEVAELAREQLERIASTGATGDARLAARTALLDSNGGQVE